MTEPTICPFCGQVNELADAEYHAACWRRHDDLITAATRAQELFELDDLEAFAKARADDAT